MQSAGLCEHTRAVSRPVSTGVIGALLLRQSLTPWVRIVVRPWGHRLGSSCPRSLTPPCFVVSFVDWTLTLFNAAICHQRCSTWASCSWRRGDCRRAYTVAVLRVERLMPWDTAASWHMNAATSSKVSVTIYAGGTIVAEPAYRSVRPCWHWKRI